MPSNYSIDQLRELRAAGMKGESLNNNFNCGSARNFIGTCDEWRVTGTPIGRPGEFPPYDFVWHGNDAEVKARCFLAQPDIEQSFDDLKLQHRVVRCSEWTDEKFVTDAGASD